MAAYFLYAEDDEDDIDILRDVLQFSKKKIRVVAVNDGWQLLNYLQNIPEYGDMPGFILLDKKMPHLNGLDTLAYLKQDNKYKTIPVILFTGILDESDLLFCRKWGADTMLKPQEFSSWNPILEKIGDYTET